VVRREIGRHRSNNESDYGNLAIPKQSTKISVRTKTAEISEESTTRFQFLAHTGRETKSGARSTQPEREKREIEDKSPKLRTNTFVT